MRMRCCDDFDVIAVVQFGTQWRQLVIDLDRNATVADIGMHGISEIHRCRTLGQGQNITFGCEYIDFVRE